MSADESIELVADVHAVVGEGPLWDIPRQRLVWVDIEGKRIHEFHPETATHQAAEVPQYPGAMVRRASGGFVAAVTDGFAAVDFDGSFEVIAPVERDLSQNRMNDGKCDSHGRFWAGTTRMAHDAAVGSLYRLDTDLSVHRMVEEVSISNGLDWTVNDDRMYFIDSLTFRVDVFDFDAASGDLSNRRTVFDVPEEWGFPDGMTLDAEDYLWIAFWGSGAVRRFDPHGNLDREIKLPVSQVTSCAFGGPDLRDLYITTGARGLDAEALRREPYAGGVFRAKPGVTGRPAHDFSG